MPRIRVKFSFVILFAFAVALTPPLRLAAILCAAALHETGHLVAMRLCGVRARTVTLSGCGADIAADTGIIPYKAAVLVWSAGCAVNLLSAAAAYGVIRALSSACGMASEIPSICANGGIPSLYAGRGFVSVCMNGISPVYADGGTSFTGVTGIIAAVCGFMGEFAAMSLGFAAVNLLPVRPLDGGMAFYSLLLLKLPLDKAKIVSDVSAALCLIPLWAAALYILFYTSMNFTPLLLCAYLFSAAFLSKSEDL